MSARRTVDTLVDHRPSEPPSMTAQEAALYDSVVVPRWSLLFGRALLARIPKGTRGQVLDVRCGSGFPALEILPRLAEGGRLIAIDRDQALVDLARRRALGDAGKRIFFKVEPLERLSFRDEVFDWIIANLAFDESTDEEAVLAEIARVLAPGGRLLATRALHGTFAEVLDAFEEIAVARESEDLAKKVVELRERVPTVDEWRATLEGAGFDDIQIETEQHVLTFSSPRELFNDPLVRSVALPQWRWLCGMEAGGERLLDDVQRVLSTYGGAGPWILTVQAGTLSARKLVSG